MPTARRLFRLLLLLAAAVVLLEGVERIARLWVERHQQVDASWIWDRDWPSHPAKAHAFQATAQISLERPAPAARLLIVADEEYLVYLDGTWVGAGVYRGDATWDSYPVGRLLGLGRHQLTVTLRSSRGVGGLLLCLELEPEAGCALRSDGSWRIHHHYLSPGDLEQEGDAPLVFGPAHAGRWQAPRAIEMRPLYADCVDFERAFGMTSTVDRGTHPMRRDDGSLAEIQVQRLRWRHPTEGIFVLELEHPAERQLAVLTPLGRAGPAQPEDPKLVLVTQPGQSQYLSVAARRLRAIDILGEVEIAGAFIHPLEEGCEELWAIETEAPRGLMGFTAPRVNAVEHELRTVF